MHFFVLIGVRLLEAMFIVGAAGSFLVLVLSAIEDFEMLLEKDEPPPQAAQQE